jgi:hypothetical protein
MTAAAPAAALPGKGAWLFSRRTDLQIFGAPALVSLALVGIGLLTGRASGDTPVGLWLMAVVLVDVAHVWSTVYRVYADPVEVRRRPLLYLGVPAIVYAIGVALHLRGPLLFWRVLAYGAVFHFVRQQYGWVMLYRRRSGDRDRLGRIVDSAAIYACTLYPLIAWHASLPRRFHWFLPGDFIGGLPRSVERAAFAGYVLSLSAYAALAIRDALRGRASWGKHLVVGSTAICWYLGIVAFDSDYVFTVTNVLIHGVPYFALVFRYGRRRFEGERGAAASLFRAGWPAFYAVLVAVALVEEGIWDAFVWHDHPRVSGPIAVDLPAVALALLVPLLAVPQGVHYVLDGFIWKVGPKNPGLAERLDL